MKISKYLIIFTLFFLLGASVPVLADSHASNAVDKGNGENEIEDHGVVDNPHFSTSTATSSYKDDQNEDRNDDDQATTSEATSTDDHGHQSSVADEHRSAVSTFVHTLLSVSDREGGIGAQVREIAQHQNDRATSTEDAINKIENRSNILNFFFGTDFNSLDRLKSAMASTTDELNKLEILSASTTNAADKATIDAQIKALQDNQSKIQIMIDESENQVSLFGWLVKLFHRGK